MNNHCWIPARTQAAFRIAVYIHLGPTAVFNRVSNSKAQRRHLFFRHAASALALIRGSYETRNTVTSTQTALRRCRVAQPDNNMATVKLKGQRARDSRAWYSASLTSARGIGSCLDRGTEAWSFDVKAMLVPPENPSLVKEFEFKQASFSSTPAHCQKPTAVFHTRARAHAERKLVSLIHIRMRSRTQSSWFMLLRMRYEARCVVNSTSVRVPLRARSRVQIGKYG